MFKVFNLITFCLIIAGCYADPQLPQYKMCVPHHIFEACEELMANKPTDTVSIKCIPARDRMECLQFVNLRKADFVAVDPEDMYVAYHLNNEDFQVFSEIRTVEEPEAEFRYEGIILVRKNSNIHSLNDLKDKKSCHTGYGRNVGYKIPLTKLKNSGILKTSKDPTLSPVEKELKSLSEFFSSSCLVGPYSPDENANNVLKKLYSNLCQLCDNSESCNNTDIYSGYEGAIRCLVENNGDIAFTKVIYVRKFFGLPVGNNPPVGPAKANADDYEYLCEDGTRKSIIGGACSWAQRPWQGYMGNADIRQKVERLQKRISDFYSNGKLSENKEAATKMWIKDTNIVVAKVTPVQPHDHLVRAQYKDVIERSGVMDGKLKLCVSNEMEKKKCEVLKNAAFSRDIRPELECIFKSKELCIKAVNEGKADIVVLQPIDYSKARENSLKPIVFEEYDPEDKVCIVISKSMKNDILRRGETLAVDLTNQRAIDAALKFNDKRDKRVCPNALVNDDESPMKVVLAKDLHSHNNIELVCPDLSRKPTTEYKSCNFDSKLHAAIFAKTTISENQLNIINHVFTALSDKFGHEKKLEDVFELFGEYAKGEKNVLFSDRAISFITSLSEDTHNDEEQYKKLHCL